MDFHDSPAQHHAAVVQQYPRNWSPPGPDHGRKDARNDDKRDKRDERGKKDQR
jgi:hypothetical protein